MASPARTLDALSDAIKGDASRISDPGDTGTIRPNITPARCVLSGGGGTYTRTLAAPLYAGMELTLECSALTGTIETTSSTAINAAGNTAITHSAAGHVAVLRSIQVGSNYQWRLVRVDGASAGP